MSRGNSFLDYLSPGDLLGAERRLEALQQGLGRRRDGPVSINAGHWMTPSLQVLLAEVPVRALDVFLFHPFLGHLLGLGRRNDDLVARTPVGRGGDAVLVGVLEGLNEAQDFVHVPAGRQRVVNDRPDDPKSFLFILGQDGSPYCQAPLEARFEAAIKSLFSQPGERLIEHRNHDQRGKVLKELHGILNPGGILSSSNHHLRDDDFVSGLTEAGLFRIIQKGQKMYSFQKIG